MKSGTNLLCRLFYAFQNTAVVDAEVPLEDFANMKAKKGFLIAKLGASCVLTGNIPPGYERRQETLIQNAGIRVINLIRDGRDVILSQQGRVTPERWAKAIEESERFEELVDLTVRFEELIQMPNDVQREIAETFGMEIKNMFHKYPKFVPDKVFNLWGPRKPEYRARPLDASRVGKWVASELPEMTEEDSDAFDNALTKAGYE